MQRRERTSLNYNFQPKQNFDALLAKENRKKYRKQYKDIIK